MVTLVPDQVLEHEDRMVVVQVHAAARLKPALHGIPDGLRAVVQQLRDALAIPFGPPFAFRQRRAEFGSVLGHEHEPHVVDVHQELSDCRTAIHRDRVHPRLRECAQQVDQNRVVAIPGVQQRIEQRSVVHLRHIRRHPRSIAHASNHALPSIAPPSPRRLTGTGVSGSHARIALSS